MIREWLTIVFPPFCSGVARNATTDYIGDIKNKTQRKIKHLPYFVFSFWRVLNFV
jgi:hypothetical protein